MLWSPILLWGSLMCKPYHGFDYVGKFFHSNQHSEGSSPDSMLCQEAQQGIFWRRRRGLTWKG